MTEERRLHVTPMVAVMAVLSLLLIGGGGTYLLMREGSAPEVTPTSAPGATSDAVIGRAASTSPDVVVTLTKAAADRAGIHLTPISMPVGTETLRVPGIVEPNAYQQVTVTPLVSGRIVMVSAQLGDRVRKGQPLAEVYSPELAEARTKYIAARAMLDAHDRELQRTEKLVEIGAASRQELERIHAEHAAQTAEVESARSRLELLGAAGDEGSSKSQADATTRVPAPIDGVITERLANVGLNVDPTSRLFSVVDLSNVWIIADVYERDLARVREGVRATVTTAASPGQLLAGRVSFIDPQLNSATRTARIRVEVANPRGDLRLGMYTEVAIESAGTASALAVPRDAVQSVGDKQVIYLSVPNDPEKFVEREVRLGRTLGDHVEVLAGLSAGDSVVSGGSFFLRSEAERLGLRGSQADVQAAKIVVTEKGFEPDKVSVPAGATVRLTFVRTTDKTCGTEVVFPSLKIKRALPLNEPVVIEFMPAQTGEVAFACGMNMLKGVVVVQ